MPKEPELREGDDAAERFRRFTKKVVRVPKSEIDRRAKDWQKAKDAEKSETAGE